MSSSGKLLGSNGGAYSGTSLFISFYIRSSYQQTQMSQRNLIPPPSGSSDIPPKQQCPMIKIHGNSTQKTKMLMAAENVVTVGKWPAER